MQMTATVVMQSQMYGMARVIAYPRRLIEDAERQFATEQYGVAILVAHMACEIAIERKLSDAFKSRGIEDLQESFYGFLNGFSVGNERLRRLYVDVTGDKIHEQPFWLEFKKSVERRNAVMHKGKMVQAQDSRDSIEAARALVIHLGYW